MDSRSSSGASGRRIVAYCLAIMSLATAVIHFAVTGSHFHEYWVFGVFMLVVAWLQLSWAIGAMAMPRPALLCGGIILNGAVVGVYIITRTVGDVIGPTPNSIEPFGFGDGFCTVLEAVIVSGCACLLVTRRDFLVRRRQLVAVPAAAGAVTAGLLSVALAAGGPEMVMSARASTPMAAMNQPGGSSAVSISLASATPAGDITMPSPGMQMMQGMKMASAAPCDTAPTTAQQKAAVSLVDTSWQDAGRYQSLAAAKAAGYRPITPSGLPVVHYLNLAFYRDTLLGGPIIDLTQPQSLVYANTPHGAVLVAAMFITTPHGPTPQPGGCLTQWHVHTNLCLTAGGNVVGLLGAAGSSCPLGSANRVTPPMMHVWFVPIPGGPTAIDASDAQIVKAAEHVSAPRNGVA